MISGNMIICLKRDGLSWQIKLLGIILKRWPLKKKRTDILKNCFKNIYSCFWYSHVKFSDNLYVIEYNISFSVKFTKKKTEIILFQSKCHFFLQHLSIMLNKICCKCLLNALSVGLSRAWNGKELLLEVIYKRLQPKNLLLVIFSPSFNVSDLFLGCQNEPEILIKLANIESSYIDLYISKLNF